MPRYIDADKIVYMECCEYDGFDLEGNPLYKRTTKADKTEIDDLPTEDVVPRSEVESLQNELAIMRNGINEYKVKLEQAKQEVARKIFEDFTKHKVCTNEEDYRVLAELKKKYIGE